MRYKNEFQNKKPFLFEDIWSVDLVYVSDTIIYTIFEIKYWDESQSYMIYPWLGNIALKSQHDLLPMRQHLLKVAT